MPAPEPGEPPSLEGDPLAALLAGRYLDEQRGALVGTAVRSVAIEDTLRDREVELVAALELGENLAILGDDATFAALGDRVTHALRSRFSVQRISLGLRPRADEETLRRLSSTIAPGTDAIVAVGSGTLNDLAKLVAKERGCPQVVFATAPSMNGYTSVSASLIEHGLKRSIRAAAPVGVFFDLSVLAAAPLRLVRAGLGDSLCRATAQADWLLSHLLLDTPYRTAPFQMLSADEQVLVANPRALMEGELEVMRSLARTLALSGFGMTMCDGSYPASQGEHLIAHYGEMMGLGVADSFHGEQIGVATVAMARLQRHVLALDATPALRGSGLSRASVVAHFGERLGERCWQEVRGKAFSAARLEELNGRLERAWPAFQEQLSAVSRPPEELTEVLLAAGAPVRPAELGWGPDATARAMRHAREIRDRYTFLDFATDLGLDPATASLG